MSITHSYAHTGHAISMVRKAFSARLRQAMDEANMEITQQSVADLFGVTKGMGSYLKNGGRMPSMDKAVKASMKLNVCVEWLLTGRGPMRPSEPISEQDDLWLYLGDLEEGQRDSIRGLIDQFRPPGKKRGKPRPAA